MSREGSDKEAIHAIRESFTRAEQRGDPSVQIERRDPETFIRMAPGRAPMDRAEANRALRALYREADIDIEWESDGVFLSGDLAVDSGSFTIERGGDSTTRRTGSWLLVYRRDAQGEWRVIRDIYN